MVGETVAGKLVVEIVGDASGLIKAYEEAKKQTEGFEGDLKSIGKSLTSIGSDLTMKVSAPLALAGGLMLKTAVDFDDSMRKVQAVTGATGDQFDKLRQTAIDLGASTAWSATESAEAMQYLGMAGLSTNEILEATPQMLSLASAGAMDLGAAADIATNVLSGFNLEISDLAHVSDVLAEAASSSNTSVEQLGHAMAYVGPVASSAGLSIEETTAAIQIMSDAGIQGTMAGTALRGALTSLLSPTKQATDILATYGLTAADVDPQVHSLAEIIDTLGAVGLSTGDAMTLFGDRAGPAMLTLIRSGGDGIRDYTQALEACDGAAQQMAETMKGGIGGTLEEMEGAIESLSIAFGGLIAEALLPVIHGVTDLANWISDLDEGTQRVIVTTGLLAAATGPVIWGLGTLAGSVGQLISLYRTYQASTIAATIATRGFSAAIAANPIGLAIIGVTTLGAVLLPLIASTNDATKAQEEYNAVLRETADLTGKTTEEIEDEIETLKEQEQQILANIEAIKAQNVVVDRGTLASRQATQATGWHKLATGDLTREFRDTTDAIKDGTVALGTLTQAQKDAALAAKQQDLAETQKARAIRETEIQTRRLAEGARIAYDEASKAVMLPLIASTKDAEQATLDYGKALKEVNGLTEKSTETIEDEIEALNEKEAQLLRDIEILRAQHTPTVLASTRAEREATQQTGWHRLVQGDLADQFRDTTETLQSAEYATKNLTQAQKDAAIAAEQQRLAENRAAQAIRDTELQTRRLADGAKTAYEQASKAVTAHQRTVSDLQKEYNELKETIDKALGIEKKIEDADRDIERADIRRIRAERDLADLQEEIKKKRAEAAAGDADAKRELEDLLLREREAVLNVAEAQDRYQDALKAASDAQQERVEIEEALNGESVSSAQERLDEIGRMLEEEQEKLDVALEKREEAQIAHENLMSQIENEALEVKSANWAEYVKFMDANPAYGRFYYVEYDENGNPIGGMPQPPVRDIQIPSYGSPAFAATSRSAASAAAGAAGGDDGVASPATGAGSAITTVKQDGKSSWNTSDYRDEDILKMVAAATAMVDVGGKQVESANAAAAQAWLQRYAPTININQVIQVQKQSATEVADATKRGLRDAALEGSL